MSLPDIVYILGTDSRWRNNEIRYSLRSLKNIEHGKVFIVGHKPLWLTDQAIHISAEDEYDNKLKNSLTKQIIAAKDPRIGDRFILMNDDFFIMEPTSIVPMHGGDLKAKMVHHETHGGYYYRALRLAYDIIRLMGTKNPKDYELHVPIMYEKKKFLDLASRIDPSIAGYLMRSIYGNFWKIGGGKTQDVKVYVNWQWNGGTFLSTDDTVTRRDEFRRWINAKFPEPSIYETSIEDVIKRPCKGNQYTVKHQIFFEGKQYNPGDIIKTDHPTPSMVPTG